MKKLNIVSLIIAITTIIVFSCKTEETCDCEAKYKKITLSINNNKIVFNDYDNKNNGRFIGTTISKNDYNILKFNQLGYKNNAYDLKAVFYIIDNRFHEISDGTQINTNIIDGSINYYINNDNLLYVTAYKKDGGNFIPTVIESMKTKFISTNDVFEIANKYIEIPDENIIVIGIINDANYINENEIYDLQYATIKDIKGKCMSPCASGNGVCKINGGNYTCDGLSLDCPTEKTAQKVQNESQSSFDILNIETDMRSFRDNYLKKSKSGIALIKYYYNVGEYLKDDFSLSFAIDTWNNLQHFQPLMNSLNNEPDNHNINLFNEQSINQLINYFTNLKQELTNNELKNQTDQVINLIRSFKNKSNYEITQIINNFSFN